MADKTKTVPAKADPKTAKPEAVTNDVPETKAKPTAQPDAASPAAQKAAAAKASDDAPKPQTYIVQSVQMIDGQWRKPDDEVEMLEVQARFRVLNGKLKRKD